MSATDPRALAVDEEQYASGEGPCLTSIRDRRVISVPDYTTDTRWPGVTAKGRQVGVYSSFSVPLEADGHVLGSYNLYGDTVGAFDEDSFRRAQTFAPQTTIAMRAVNQLHIERAQQTRDRAVAATFAAPAVAGTLALCITDGRCRAGSPARNLLTLQADAALYNLSHPNFGYQGDPLHPSLRRYHGFLVRAGSY